MDGSSSNLKKHMNKTAKRVLLKGKSLSLGGKESGILPIMPVTKVRRKPTIQRNSRDKMNRVLKRPVGYNWNKGGRLKELRIRTLVRKYLYIWQRNSFGRKTPTQADKYYQMKIIKKCFTSWKNDWWETGKEWKLIVRADYHFKYFMYAKVWRAWEEYHKQQRVKKLKMYKAQTFWKMNISYKTIIHWKIYTNTNAEKDIKNKMATELYNKKSIKSTFDLWIQIYERTKEDKRNNEIALWHWMNKIQRSSWIKWRQAYHEKQEENLVLIKADEYYKKMNIGRVWKSWVKYIHQRRNSVAEMEFASIVRRRYLVRSAICTWHKTLLRKCNIRMFETQITALGERFQQRRFFEAWKAYYDDCKCYKEKIRMADKYHRKSILAKSLRALNMKAEQRRASIDMKYSAHEHYSFQMMRRSFTVWTGKLEAKYDEKLAPKYAIAINHYNKKILSCSLAKWHDWMDDQKLKLEKYMRADAHFISKVLPKYFQIWKEYQNYHKYQQQAKEKADQFHRETCLYKYFNLMAQKIENAYEYRTMDRLAILHHNESLISSSLKLWMKKTEMKLKENHKTEIACKSYRQLLISRYFETWKYYIQSKRMKRQNVVKAAIFVYHKNIRTVIDAWKRYIMLRKHKKTKLRIVSAYYSGDLLRRSYALWKRKFEKIKRGKKIVQTQIYKMKQLLKLKAFLAWKVYFRMSKEKQNKRIQAIAMNDRTVKARYFQRWLVWNEMEAKKSVEFDVKLIQYCDCKNKQTVKRVFVKWKMKALATRQYCLNYNLAVTHYNNRLCDTILKSWILFRYIQTKKIILNERAAVFNDNLLKIHALNQWKRSFECKKEENLLTANALWFWALNLEYKVLQSWLEYTKARKQKKCCYSDALLLRRNRMLKHGCSNFLKFHAEKVAFKTQEAAWKQAKTCYNAYHLAWKYAKRWRSRIQKKRNARDYHEDTTCSKTQLEMSVQSIEEFKQIQPVSESACNWVPEPRIDPYDLSPKISKSTRLNTSTNVHRPSPRRPQFLLESLQNMDDAQKFVHFSDPIATSKTVAPIQAVEIATHENLQHSIECSNNNVKQQHSSNICYKSYAGDGDNIMTNLKHPTKQTESKHLTLMPPSAFIQTVENDIASNKDNSSLASGDGPGVNKTQFSELSVYTSMDSQSIQNEVLYISKKIQSFKKLKDNLSQLREQKTELEKYTCQSNEVTEGIKAEVNEIEIEIEDTLKSISSQRPLIENLADRVKFLVQIS